MPHFESGAMNRVAINRWQRFYSIVFLFLVLGASIFTMFKSLKSGIAGIEDNFFGKPRLITLFTRLRYSVGDQVFAQVLVGKGDWLQYSANGNLDDYQNAYVSREELESIHQKLDLLHEELAQRGITLLVVVAPNKATIYPDNVPEQIVKLSPQSQLDVFLELMQQTNSSYVVDLRPPLAQARQDHQVYYRTDTHWNSLGAYIAYREIMEALSRTYPDLQPYELDQFRWTETDPQPGDLSKIMGARFIREPRNALLPKFNSMSELQSISYPTIYASWARNGQEKTLIMYHDSFGVVLQLFLQHHFKQATYILNSTETIESKMPWIEEIKPDIVMIEVVERGLLSLDVLLSD